MALADSRVVAVGQAQRAVDLLRDIVREVIREELGTNHTQCGVAGGIRPANQIPGLDKPVYTADEVATLLGLSRKAIFARTARGQIPGAFRLGRSLRFRGPDLIAFLAEGRAPSSKETRR